MFTLLALASSLVWGTSDFVAGVKAKTRPAAAVVGWSQAIGLLAMTIAVCLRTPHFASGNWPLWAVLAGVSGSGALVCFYAALSTGTMGVVAPIASLGVVVPVILGVASGEQPALLAWVGIMVAISGVLLASGPELEGAVSRRPVVLASAAGAGFGVGLFSIHAGSADSVVDTLWLMRLTSVSLFGLAALVLRRAGGMTGADLPVLVFVGLADLVANALFGLAATRGYVSIAAVLGSLYPVVTAVLAYAVLHERLRRVQLAGVALTMAGVALIAGA
ncbi:DMT family transporter [Nostocoides vanveenii]|uniref:EamA family transporter n=1 Tax=Nostocoides vanveenii TaxID=330835 RepID=A0ABP4WNU8_9MICO